MKKPGCGGKYVTNGNGDGRNSGEREGERVSVIYKCTKTETKTD